MYRIHLQPYIQQVKMLNHLYGAACDHQYMLTAMPALTKRVTITRPTNDYNMEWQKIDSARFHNFSQLAGIFTVANAVVDLTVEGARRKRGRRRRHSKRSVNSGRSRSRLSVVESVRLDENDYFHHKQGDGVGICEECGGPLHLPRAPKQKEKELEKVPAREVPRIGAETQGKPVVNPSPGILHNWHDPHAPWNQRLKPSDGKT